MFRVSGTAWAVQDEEFPYMYVVMVLVMSMLSVTWSRVNLKHCDQLSGMKNSIKISHTNRCDLTLIR